MSLPKVGKSAKRRTIVYCNPWEKIAPSEVIRHFAFLAINASDAKPLRVWLYARKSNRGKDNLAEQVAKAVVDLASPTVHLVGITSKVETSSLLGDRDGLETAILAARDLDAILVAATRDRFVRNRVFNGRHNREEPSRRDLMELRRLAGDVVLATIADPDAPSTENRAAQIRRGRKAKGKTGGRPLSRAANRERWKPRVKELHEAAQGKISSRNLADAINREAGETVLSYRTVQRWIASK